MKKCIVTDCSVPGHATGCGWIDSMKTNPQLQCYHPQYRQQWLRAREKNTDKDKKNLRGEKHYE